MAQNYYYSRLSRRQEKFSQRQIFLFFAGSIVLLVLFVVFGIPFLFNLTSRISGLKKSSSGPSTNDQFVPAAPSLSEDYTATFSGQIKIIGTSDPKMTVELFQNDQSDGTAVTGDDGKFGFDVTLTKGTNVFYAQAVSDSGKRSDKSDLYSINYSTTPPKLDLNNLKDGDSFSSSPINISGKTDPGASITINDHQIVVGGDGSFNSNLNLSNGDNKVKIVATDQAGNQTTDQLTLKYYQ